MFPVHILMWQRVVVAAAAENSFYSGGAVRADTLHLLPDSSGYEFVCVCACAHVCVSESQCFSTEYTATLCRVCLWCCVCLCVNKCGYLSVRAITKL